LPPYKKMQDLFRDFKTVFGSHPECHKVEQKDEIADLETFLKEKSPTGPQLIFGDCLDGKLLVWFDDNVCVLGEKMSRKRRIAALNELCKEDSCCENCGVDQKNKIMDPCEQCSKYFCAKCLKHGCPSGCEDEDEAEDESDEEDEEADEAESDEEKETPKLNAFKPKYSKQGPIRKKR